MPADQLSRVFSSLADRTRRDLVARLASGDATVTALAEPYDVSLQAVSKHLKVLGDAGLVSRTPDGQRRPVHLEDEVFDLTTSRLERYRRQAEERYRRLDATWLPGAPRWVGLTHEPGVRTLPSDRTGPAPAARTGLSESFGPAPGVRRLVA